MTAGEYRKRVTVLDSAWPFTKPTNTATYNPSIKTLTAEVKKPHKEASCKLQRD